MVLIVVDGISHSVQGLIGPLLTCKRGTLDSEGRQKSIDKEFALLFTVTDESESWYHQENKQRFCSTPDKINDGEKIVIWFCTLNELMTKPMKY